jgi:hypothetical protein
MPRGRGEDSTAKICDTENNSQNKGFLGSWTNQMWGQNVKRGGVELVLVSFPLLVPKNRKCNAEGLHELH